MTPLQKHVTGYLAGGLRPIPLHGLTPEGTCQCNSPACKPRDHGKHSPVDEEIWKNGDEHYTAADFPDGSNVALAMGPQRWASPDWLVCLDSDGEAFNWRRLGMLPETMSVKSPRGEHRYFTVPAFTPLGNWVNCLGDDKESGHASLDLRYARGRIVAPPSNNAFGPYIWLRDIAPAPLPDIAIRQILQKRADRGLKNTAVWERKGKNV